MFCILFLKNIFFVKVWEMGTIFDRASECATKGRSNLIDLKLVLSVVEGTDVKKRNFGRSLDFVKNVSNFQEKVPDTFSSRLLVAVKP